MTMKLEDYGDLIYLVDDEGSIEAEARKVSQGEYRWSVRQGAAFDLCRTKSEARRKLKALAS